MSIRKIHRTDALEAGGQNLVEKERRKTAREVIRSASILVEPGKVDRDRADAIAQSPRAVEAEDVDRADDDDPAHLSGLASMSEAMAACGRKKPVGVNKRPFAWILDLELDRSTGALAFSVRRSFARTDLAPVDDAPTRRRQALRCRGCSI